MELLLLVVVGAIACWVVYRSVATAAKEGQCAGCSKNCQQKTCSEKPKLEP